MAMTQAELLKNQLTTKENQAPADKKEAPRTIKSELERMRPEFMNALPNGKKDAERFIRIALTTIRQNPKLADCTPASLMGALVQAAQVGLEPDALGSCYLVPYKRNYKENGEWKHVYEVQFQIGYKGMLELVRRTGEVQKITAHEVFERDFFEFEYGTDERLKHVPYMGGDRGEIYAFYAHARFRDGGDAFAVMSRADVDRVRDTLSKAKDNGPWKDHYESMAKKTVIKNLIKYMPISVDIQRNISADDTVRPDINAEPINVIDMEPAE